MFTDEFGDKFAKKIFLDNDCFDNNKQEDQNTSNYRIVIEEIIEVLDIPNFLSVYPDFIFNKYILNELSILLWQNISPSTRSELIEKKRNPKFFNKNTNSTILRARTLNNEGYYPNVNLANDMNIYAFRNNVPLLITKEPKQRVSYSEMDFLNDNELIIASAIILSPTYPTGFLYFDKHNIMNLDLRAFGNLNEHQIIDLLFEFLVLRSNKYNNSNSISKTSIDSSGYKYYNFISNLEHFHTLCEKISKTDQLMMRTLYYLVKSKMLWTNRCFGEDAISNVLFSIEGSLLLLQRKFGLSDKKINIIELEKIFSKTFPNGDELFDIVKEGYEIRISIVHAKSKFETKWLPSLLADDYFDYNSICRFLLIYILLDKIVESETNICA